MPPSPASPFPVPLRQAWPLEAQHFTRWLAENLDRLGSALGLSLTALSKKAVGHSRIADLFACDRGDGSRVLIENQLEAADDAHLGQILTYLAGSGAKTLVWIAKHFDAGRLGVVRWLNAATAADYRFFAVRVEVVRIEGFELEVRFHVLEAPSDWKAPTATIPGASRGFGFPASFWAAHGQWHPDEAAASRQVGARVRWRATKIKSVVMGLHVEPNSAQVFLRGRHGVTRDAARNALAPLAKQIEQEIGVPMDDAACSVLALSRRSIDMTDQANWPAASSWLTSQSLRYDAVLNGRRAW